ncbi:MAG TPA: hypothetical protein VG604_01635 [Candidatus Saccharimonadales bacterium]|nr:hypothetical protein [Candidatus Saccharimonadales bacterium]
MTDVLDGLQQEAVGNAVSSNETSRVAQIQRLAGKVLLPFAVMTPVAAASAAVTDAWIAPPAHVSTPIAGADVTAEAVPNSDLINLNLQVGNVQRTSHIHALGLDLGANITFHFNNVSLDDNKESVNPEVAKQFAHEFSDLRPEIASIESAMEQHYENWAIGGAALVYASGFGGLGWRSFRHRQLMSYSADKRQHVLDDRKFPRRVSATIATLSAGALLGSGVYIYTAPTDHHNITADRNLADTALAGSRVTGLIKPAADWAAGFFAAKNAFYDAEEKNFTASFIQRYGSSSLAPQSGLKRIILADDYQGEDGPARITGDVARAYNANLIVVGGDITATSSPLETPVLDALRSHSGKIPIELSLGHHDGADIAAMAKARHMYVANGTVQTINGIRIAGFNSPDVVPFGGQAVLRDPKAWPAGETIAEATQALTASAIDQARSQTSPAIFEMHDQLIGTPIAQANCPNVPLVLTGRQSPPHPPVAYRDTTEFISGSTGAHSNYPTPQVFGIIHARGIIQEITINDQYQVVSSDLITLEGPSTAVSIQNNLADIQTPVQAKISPVSVSR